MVEARSRSLLAVVPVIAALGLFCVVAPHDVAEFVHARGGVVGQLVGEVKREDDEAELSEIRAQRPQTRQDGEEARELAEAAEYQPTAPAEGEGP